MSKKITIEHITEEDWNIWKKHIQNEKREHNNNPKIKTEVDLISDMSEEEIKETDKIIKQWENEQKKIKEISSIMKQLDTENFELNEKSKRYVKKKNFYS